MNNKELYQLVTNELGKDIPEDKQPRLDSYLIALWQISARSNKPKPTIDDLIGWLKHAFTAEETKFEPQWMLRTVEFAESAYAEWENTILVQIKQLSEIFEEVPENELKNHYGRDNWYNFRVRSYVSNGVNGLYGGDEEDEGEPYEVDTFSWQDFADLLEMGKTFD
jgi:hypothetical protein